MDGNAWRDRPATGDDIRAALGDADDVTMVSVLQLAPTRGELLEAQAWLTSDECVARSPRHGLQGKAAAICDIVEADLPTEER